MYLKIIICLLLINLPQLTLKRIEMENEIVSWLNRIDTNEVVPAEISALNVGLFESEDGYRLYLTGAVNYDADDDDWACDQDYEPAEKYIPVSVGGDMDWESFLNSAIAIVKKYLAEHPESKVFDRIVTVGFDDGDLTRVK